MMNVSKLSSFGRVLRGAFAIGSVAAIAALASSCREDPPQQPLPPPPNYQQGGPGYYGQQGGNPLGLPCASDGGQCGGHRCNLGSGRCAFPCQGNAECLPGWSCAAGVCVLGMPGVPMMPQ
jgi:hypothetical protein